MPIRSLLVRARLGRLRSPRRSLWGSLRSDHTLYRRTRLASSRPRPSPSCRRRWSQFPARYQPRTLRPRFRRRSWQVVRCPLNSSRMLRLLREHLVRHRFCSSKCSIRGRVQCSFSLSSSRCLVRADSLVAGRVKVFDTLLYFGWTKCLGFPLSCGLIYTY